MKKEDMVVGREYLHCGTAFNERYVFVRHGSLGRGVFSEPVTGIDYVLTFSNMTEAPEAKPQFEFDDEIEISFNSGFADRSGTFKGKFKHLDPSGPYWAVDKDGFMRCGDFARKVEPMVKVRVCLAENDFSYTTTVHEIRKSLADKLIAGDFNV